MDNRNHIKKNVESVPINADVNEALLHITSLLNRVDERTEIQSKIVEELRKKLSKIDVYDITKMRETIIEHDRQIFVWKGYILLFSAVVTLLATYIISIYK